MEKVKILMADDEPDILAAMAKKVSQEGYEVITAGDGQEAWDKIQEHNPDIILLDLNMPELDGFEVLQRVRENPDAGKWQPVIIVSGRSELQDMQKIYSLEADHYISKPCQLDDILKSLMLMESLISRKKASAE